MSIVPRDKNATNVTTPKADNTVDQAAEEWLGGYFVVDHTACGRPNLDEPDSDVWGFINNCASWQKKSFVYGEGDVWSDDFRSDSDHYPAGHLPTGFDGVDSVVVAYISTHGRRLDANTARIVAGGTGHGGCTVRSTRMSLGENDLRYLFLSVCQCVSTDPGSIWFGAANGIRAILGYDTDSIDSPDYGKFFFELWKRPRAKTAQSFLDASWRVDHGQTPVAAFFGPNEATASNLRDNEEYFNHSSISSDAIAYTWYDARTLDKDIVFPDVSQMTLRFAAAGERPAGADVIARFALHPGALSIGETTVSGDNVCYTTDDGSVLVYNTHSGSTDLTLPTFTSTQAVEFADDEAVELASNYLGRVQDKLSLGPVDTAIELAPFEVRHTMTGSATRSGDSTTPTITHATVIFRQIVAGLPTVGTGGVVEVTLNGAREVCRVRSVLRTIESVSGGGPTYDLATLVERATERALAEVRARPYVTGATVISSQFGFYAADEGVSQRSSEPTARIVVEMQSEEFSKRVEKLYPISELIADEQV